MFQSKRIPAPSIAVSPGRFCEIYGTEEGDAMYAAPEDGLSHW